MAGDAWDGVTNAAGDLWDGTVETADRAGEFLKYSWYAALRRGQDPIQTFIDMSTGTFYLEELAAGGAIILGDGQVYRGGEYCGSEAECIINVNTPKGGGITLGHTVILDEDPGQNPNGDALVAHEIQHVYDIESVGGFGFYGSYLASWGLNVAGLAKQEFDHGASAGEVVRTVAAEAQNQPYRDIFWEQRGYAVSEGYQNGVRPEKLTPQTDIGSVIDTVSNGVSKAGDLLDRVLPW